MDFSELLQLRQVRRKPKSQKYCQFLFNFWNPTVILSHLNPSCLFILLMGMSLTNHLDCLCPPLLIAGIKAVHLRHNQRDQIQLQEVIISDAVCLCAIVMHRYIQILSWRKSSGTRAILVIPKKRRLDKTMIAKYAYFLFLILLPPTLFHHERHSEL